MTAVLPEKGSRKASDIASADERLAVTAELLDALHA